jgi:hypothetical protein
MQHLSERFTIPNYKKYLVFKVAKNSTINSENVLANMIRFEVVGLKRSYTNHNIIVEETFSVPLTKESYVDGFAHAYYTRESGDGSLAHFLFCG